jgi:hypothetical protein
MFGIKAGYRHRDQACYFLDDVTATRGVVFQPDVYTFAEEVAARRDPLGREIVDVGCGWGDKLAAMHARRPAWSYVGIDFGANIEHCRVEHPFAEWIEADLERPLAFSPLSVAPGAVVICSDVIEHLVNPNVLVESLRAFGPGTEIVLSTPDRDVNHGYDHNGPPPNLNHVREWNSAELVAYLEEGGLRVKHCGLTRGSDNSSVMGTTLVWATPA